MQGELSPEELPKAYDPKETEDRIYSIWEKSGAFSPRLAPDTQNLTPFVIVLPPPNVTGSLHMGHALNGTIQDILIRRSRMKGGTRRRRKRPRRSRSCARTTMSAVISSLFAKSSNALKKAPKSVQFGNASPLYLKRLERFQ